MEEQQQPPVNTFPAPPSFWEAFTPENIRDVVSRRAEQFPNAKYDPSINLPPRILDLPAEIRFLQPPEPPADGKYRCFGALYDIEDPLFEPPELLYTPTDSPNGKRIDRSFILKRIAKSLLLNFLELVGIMTINPAMNFDPNVEPELKTDAERKIEDIRILFVNFHHLLNEYRPHQARESLILMMQDQLEKSQAETKAMEDMKAKVEAILEGLSRAKLADTGDEKKSKEGFVEDGKDVWDELEKEFGA